MTTEKTSYMEKGNYADNSKMECACAALVFSGVPMAVGGCFLMYEVEQELKAGVPYSGDLEAKYQAAYALTLYGGALTGAGAACGVVAAKEPPQWGRPAKDEEDE